LSSRPTPYPKMRMRSLIVALHNGHARGSAAQPSQQQRCLQGRNSTARGSCKEATLDRERNTDGGRAHGSSGTGVVGSIAVCGTSQQMTHAWSEAVAAACTRFSDARTSVSSALTCAKGVEGWLWRVELSWRGAACRVAGRLRPVSWRAATAGCFDLDRTHVWAACEGVSTAPRQLL
jgi:hypothetical protein